MKIKEFIGSLVFIIILLITYGFFPVKNIFQQVVVIFVFFGILPVLFNKFILKRSLQDVNVRIGDWRQGLLWSGVLVVVSIIVILILDHFFGFLKHYTVPISIIHSFKAFILYEFTGVIFLVFMYEFFFRGFMISILKMRLGYWAIIIQALTFMLLAATIGDSTWKLVPYVVFAPLAGVVVYKSGSILYSSTLQFLLFVILDASVVRMMK